MTLTPKWNWRSRCLIAVSMVFWIFFASVTAMIARGVVIQFIKQADKNSIAGLLIVGAMIVGASVWGHGMIRLRGVSYYAHIEGSFFIWKELRSGKVREKKIDLTSIESFGPTGSPGIGFSLQITTRTKTHRLGTFLPMDDVEKVSNLIGQSLAAQADAIPCVSPGA